MLSWPALLLAPLLALTQLSIAYALVSPACAGQDRSTLHAVAAVSLLLVLATIALAWLDWRGRATPSHEDGGARPATAPSVTRADSADAVERPHFVAQVAVVVGAISALVSLALWLPIWMLSPCY